MKGKSAKLIAFIEDLHKSIVNSPHFRKLTKGKTEKQIQVEIRPLIIRYLERYFEELGYKDGAAKAKKAFYWEGQEGTHGKPKEKLFSARNYPDFIITKPYSIAIEYKQSHLGSTVKHGVGQSVMHTLSGEFDYVYYLFQDQTKDKTIRDSMKNKNEKMIAERMQKDFNIFMKII